MFFAPILLEAQKWSPTWKTACIRAGYDIYQHLIQKEQMNNCILQFLKNETKTFLVLQNIFYSLLMKVSVHC